MADDSENESMQRHLFTVNQECYSFLVPKRASPEQLIVFKVKFLNSFTGQFAKYNELDYDWAAAWKRKREFS